MIKTTVGYTGVALLLALLAAGCSSSGDTKSGEGAGAGANAGGGLSGNPGGTNGSGGPVDLTAGQGQGQAGLGDISQHSIYFDYDKDEIKPEYQPVIASWAKYLAAHTTTKVQLQGNADERGTPEYNVALGERRANEVSRELTSQGASSQQVSVISYGKERPICQQHEESCWQQNRRVDLVQQ